MRSIAFALALFFGCAQSEPLEIDGDLLVIDQLREAGSDLSKPHKIDFFFDITSELPARELCSFLRHEGFEREVFVDHEVGQYSCRATKWLIPKIETVRKMRERFTILAWQRGGVFDGWGAEIMK